MVTARECIDDLVAIHQEAISAERDRCAKIAEYLGCWCGNLPRHGDLEHHHACPMAIAEAIREGGREDR